MRLILLLTKNILVEQRLQNQLSKHCLKVLTKKEKKVFLYLSEAIGDIVTPKKLCDYLWNEPLSHPQMTMLVKIYYG